jgi:predicted transposase/invertase (TIGR01784 family)
MLHKNVDRFIEEWKAEGRAEGEARGRAEGEARGRAEGEAKGIQKVAKKMLSTGMPIHQVSEITGLSKEELKNLRNSIAN